MTAPNSSALPSPCTVAGKPARNELRSAWIESRSGIRALEPEWSSLVESNPHASPFLRPEWISSTLESFLPKAAPAILATRENSKLAGIIPLVRSNVWFGRLPLRTLRSISSIHSIRSDFIEGASQSDAVTECTWAALKSDPWWTAIRLDDVPETGSFHRVLQLAEADGFLTARWRTRLSPIIPLPASGDPLSDCPKRYKSFRNRLKGKLTKLSVQGAVSFETSERAEPELTEAFFELEAAGWKGQAGSAILSHPATRRFYTEIISHAASRGYLRVYTMKLNDKPIAMHLGLFYGGVYYSPKVAYDETYREYSLGHLLMRHIALDLPTIGASRFELLGPNALWKSVWSTTLRRHDNCYIFRPSISGRAAYLTLTQLACRLRNLRYRFKGDPQHIP